MKKKIIYSVIAISLMAVLVIAYMQMSGNTTDKYKAKKSLVEFLEQTYPDMDYEIKRSVGYGWTDRTYEFNVVVKDSMAVETTYRFYVSGIEPYEVFGDTIHESKVDNEASEKLSAEATRYIRALLKGKVPQVDTVDAYVEIYNNVSEEWNPQMKTPKPIEIILGINKGDMTKEQMLEQCKAIQKLLKDESIDYSFTDINYGNIGHGEKDDVFISFTPGQELTINDLK